MIQEVFALQTQEVQTFLLRTAILERMTGSLCEAITGQAGGQAMLEHVEQANLFLQPLDDERRWYRYHHLFAELLRFHLQQEQPERVPILHLQASRWYEHHGLLPEAIRHALQAADVQRAATLIEEVGSTLIKQGAFTTLSPWLDQLPAEEILSRPNLAVLQGWQLLLSGQRAAAERQLEEIEQRYALDAARQALDGLTSLPEDKQPVRYVIGEIAAIRAFMAITQEDGANTIVFAREALRFLSEADISRGIVTWFLSVAYRLAGDVDAALTAAAEASASSMATGNLYVACLATHELASLHEVQGSLYQAEQVYQQAIQLAQQGGATVVLGPIYVGLGHVQYEWNNLAEAERLLREGIEHCLSMENITVALEGFVSLVMVSSALSKWDGVQALLKEMNHLASKPNISRTTIHFVAAFQAWLAVKQGDQKAAVRWIQHCGLHAQDEIKPPRFDEYLILVRMLLAQGNFDDAFTCLRHLFHLAQSGRRSKNTMEVFVLQALAHQAQGKLEAACDHLENALRLAEPEGYIRLFIDEGASLADILMLIHAKLQERPHPPTPRHERNLPSVSYIEKLLAAFQNESVPASGILPQSAPSTPVGTPSSLAEPLSARELDVLRLLAQGYSNREIADRLVLAVSTVKWYVNIIFGKLQVESRTRAVARAKELHLL